MLHFGLSKLSGRKKLGTQILVVKTVGLISSLTILLITSRFLGAEGRGTLALVSNYVNLSVLLGGFFGGSALFSILKQVLPERILLLSFIGQAVVIIVGYLVLLVNTTFELEILALAGVLCFFNFQISQLTYILSFQGRSLLAAALQLIGPIFFIIVVSAVLVLNIKLTVFFCLNLLAFSAIVTFILMMISIRPTRSNFSLDFSFKKIGSQLLGSTLYPQLGNLSQFLCYRLTQFVISTYLGLTYLGKFSVVTTIMEVIWIPCSTIALLQTSEIASGRLTEEAHLITARISRIFLLFTACASIIIIVLLYFFDDNLFGSTFSNLWSMAAILSPGVIAIGATMPLSHYFLAKGFFTKNLIASLVGLILQVFILYCIVPRSISLQTMSLTIAASNIATSFVLVLLFERLNGQKVFSVSAYIIDIHKFFVNFSKINPRRE